MAWVQELCWVPGHKMITGQHPKSLQLEDVSVRVPPENQNQLGKEIERDRERFKELAPMTCGDQKFQNPQDKRACWKLRISMAQF